MNTLWLLVLSKENITIDEHIYTHHKYSKEESDADDFVAHFEVFVYHTETECQNRIIFNFLVPYLYLNQTLM